MSVDPGTPATSEEGDDVDVVMAMVVSLVGVTAWWVVHIMIKT